MILTDREIQNSIASGLISIDPPPSRQSYASTSVDLTLAAEIRAFKDQDPGLETAIDPMRPGYNIAKLLNSLTEQILIDQKDGYILQPKKLILAWTAEGIKLHTHGRVAARVEGKSSLARIGLAIHVTAPTIHAGFSAKSIQLEIINHGPLPIKLHQGMPICQLIFEQTLGMPDKAYEGQFSGQSPR